MPSCLQAVIGAGAAGLVAAKELRAEGHQVHIFEQGSSVGGVWAYVDEVDADPLGATATQRVVHSSMYQSLRTNLPREIMGFVDFPFDPDFLGPYSTDPRRFCGHREVPKGFLPR